MKNQSFIQQLKPWPQATCKSYWLVQPGVTRVCGNVQLTSMPAAIETNNSADDALDIAQLPLLALLAPQWLKLKQYFGSGHLEHQQSWSSSCQQ